MPAIRLGVNIDHVATLRNARGGSHPDPLAAARLALQAGADSITMHLREDRRHITDEDLARVRGESDIKVNLEMAPTAEMIGIAQRIRPYACCLVPEHRAELTTEGGLDVAAQFDKLYPLIYTLIGIGIRVSVFIEPVPLQLESARSLRVHAVELHTGLYAAGRAGELDKIKQAARLTTELDIECHAGHGLTFDNVGPIAAIPQVRELNIGHFLIGEALFSGLGGAVTRMRELMKAARPAE